MRTFKEYITEKSEDDMLGVLNDASTDEYGDVVTKALDKLLSKLGDKDRNSSSWEDMPTYQKIEDLSSKEIKSIYKGLSSVMAKESINEVAPESREDMYARMAEMDKLVPGWTKKKIKVEDDEAAMSLYLDITKLGKKLKGDNKAVWEEGKKMIDDSSLSDNDKKWTLLGLYQYV